MMDGLSAAASITAVLTIALQSARVIFKVADASRSYSKHINLLATRADALLRILTQLAALVGKVSQNEYSESSYDFGELKTSLNLCVNDLQKVRETMSKLEHPRNNVLRKSNLIIKNLLGSKDIEHASSQIHFQVSVLSAQLSILGR